MKQIKLTFLLAALLCMVGTQTFAYDAKINGIYYDFSGTNATVTYYSNSSSSNQTAYSGTVTIPESVTYNGKTYPVTSIGEYAFRGCSGLTSVTIPNSVTSIGDWAFADCSGLTSVTIPNSVTSIGDEFVFGDCSSLTSVTIGNGVTSIPGTAFYGCYNLSNISIPNSVEKIRIGAFKYTAWYRNQPDGLVYAGKVAYEYKGTMPANTEIVLREGTLGIAGEAFRRNNNLISVKIPEGLTNIGANAFDRCSNLKTINIPNSVTSLEWQALTNTAWINNLYKNSPDGPIYVGKMLLGWKGSMPANTHVEIKEGTLGIASAAFEDCRGMGSIAIPSSIKHIDEDAFLRASGLTAVYITDLAAWCKISFEGNPLNTAHHLYLNAKEIKDLVIPDGVTTISKSAFSGCSGLTSVTIPNSVTSIGDRAFLRCSGLTSVTIPNSVTSIREEAFSGCSGLTAVHITDLEAWCNISGLSNLSSYCTYNMYLNGEKVKDLVIPNSMKTIGGNVFENCTSLTSVSIPNSVTLVGGSAFNNCSGLTSVTIPNSVTSIGQNAFSGCNGLTSVTIPNSVTTIGDYAFEDCSGLTSVTIPNSVTSIGNWAFSGCSGLISTTIPNSVTNIGDMAFYNCGGLFTLHCSSVGSWFSSRYRDNTFIKDIVLGDEVTSICDSVFYGCSSLQSVVVGNGITNLPAYVFGTGNNLKSLTIGSSVQTIHKNAFQSYSSRYSPVKTIWLTNTPPSGYSEAAGWVNYVANDLYTSLSNKTVYPFLSSVFEADGVKYVPVSPSERTCDAIDCVYNASAATTKISPTASYRGITMSVQKVQPYVCYENSYIENLVYDIEGDMPSYALYNCSNQKKVTLGEKVKSIGSSAFSNCTSLPSIVIPEGVGTIDSYAFAGCTALSDLQIGSNVKVISTSAFSNCSALPKVVIPKSVDKISDYVFSGCLALREVVIERKYSETAEKRSFSEWVSSNKGKNNSTSSETWEIDVVPGDELSFDYKVSSELGYDKLIITLDGDTIAEDSGEKTASYSKTYDNACTSILVASYVKDEYEYGGSDQARVYNIGVNLSDELSLGSNDSNPLFSSCPLDSVYIGRNISYSTSSSYGYSPFYRNTSVRSVTITDRETEISPNEFYGCTNLKNVSIGDGVETIGNWAFSGCSSLDYFSFGSSVKTIGQEAFSDCTAMTRLISHATTPPTCGSQALDDINKWNCTLSVPEGTTSAYQAAEQWKEFFFINNDIDIVTGVHQVDSGELTVDSWYSLDGKKLAGEPKEKGIYIRNGRKVVK